MAISEAYQETLKRRAVGRFIKNNDRSPTETELSDLILREQRNYPSVDQVGVSGFDLKKPGYASEASASVENTNRTAIFDDMVTVSNRLGDVAELLEDSFRGFISTQRRVKKLLTQLENRVDNLLLLNGNPDVFVYGIEEDFRTQEDIDIERTTASVETHYVTLGRQGYNKIPLDDVRVTATTTSARGFTGTETAESIDSLKRQDGSMWEHLVYTRERQGRVSMLMQMELPEAYYVGDVRITGSPVAVNQKMTVTLFYSLDGQTFTALEPIERVWTDDEMYFNIGLEGVQIIQLLVSKNAADSATPANNQFVYIFSFDSVELFGDTYTELKESELYAGPYTILNELGDPVYFSKATLSACRVTPDNTDISFFLSKDGITYQPVDPDARAQAIVAFGDSSKTGTEYVIDATQASDTLLEEVEDLEELDFRTEAIINTGVDAEFADTVPYRTIQIKRNIPDPTASEVYGAPRGWFFNEEDTTYTTTVYIDDPEGRYINVGSSGISVNGNLLSGRVHLKSGYSIIETDDNNWYEIPESIQNTDELIDADPLYPYNHRYIIAGYNYPDSFVGEKVYNGVYEHFGRLLQYIPSERFNALDEVSISTLGFFTVEDADGNLYFKVKVDKTDPTWRDETYELDWSVQADATSEIYVKAVLTSTEQELSPTLQSFGVRVI